MIEFVVSFDLAIIACVLLGLIFGVLLVGFICLIKLFGEMKDDVYWFKQNMVGKSMSIFEKVSNINSILEKSVVMTFEKPVEKKSKITVKKGGKKK